MPEVTPAGKPGKVGTVVATPTVPVFATVVQQWMWATLVGLLNPGGSTARFINGRYVDRLEKRDGQWRIALRRCTVDLLIAGDASILQMPQFKEGGYIKGERSGADVSYQRPLSLEMPAARW